MGHLRPQTGESFVNFFLETHKYIGRCVEMKSYEKKISTLAGFILENLYSNIQ